MKTFNFKQLIGSLLFLFLLATSCNENKSSDSISNPNDQKPTDKEKFERLQNALDSDFKFGEKIPENFDFCEGEEAIIPKSEYNRISGIANFSIPIPKGANLDYVNFENDTLYYVATGNGNAKYSDKALRLEHETKTGLTRGDLTKKLWVTVTFSNFNGDECTTTELNKKKTSEVTGTPFRPKN